jgi:hypothetical protein
MNPDGPASAPARSWILVMVAALATSACPANSTDEAGNAQEVAVDADIQEILVRHTPTLMRIDGVQGVGQALCDSVPCIRVYVLDAAAQARVPPRIDGIPVSTVITGVIRTSPGT